MFLNFVCFYKKNEDIGLATNEGSPSNGNIKFFKKNSFKIFICNKLLFGAAIGMRLYIY